MEKISQEKIIVGKKDIPDSLFKKAKAPVMSS